MGDRRNRVNALEGGQHHGQLKAHFVLFINIAKVIELGHPHFSLFHPRGFGVGDPLHIPVSHLGLEHRFAVTHPA